MWKGFSALLAPRNVSFLFSLIWLELTQPLLPFRFCSSCDTCVFIVLEVFIFLVVLGVLVVFLVLAVLAKVFL